MLAKLRRERCVGRGGGGEQRIYGRKGQERKAE